MSYINITLYAYSTLLKSELIYWTFKNVFTFEISHEIFIFHKINQCLNKTKLLFVVAQNTN